MIIDLHLTSQVFKVDVWEWQEKLLWLQHCDAAAVPY